MIALASVDLPEPLGPMRAWISPGLTMRSTPLRICLSSAWTWRLRISSSGMVSLASGLGCVTVVVVSDVGCGRGVLALPRELAGLEVDELGERRVRERLEDADLHARPQELRRAAATGVVVVRAEDAAVLAAVVDEALHRRERALEREHHLVHCDGLRRARETVAAVGSARRFDEVGALEQRDDPLEVGERQVLGIGDRFQRHRLLLRLAPELDEQAHAVLRFG